MEGLFIGVPQSTYENSSWTLSGSRYRI